MRVGVLILALSGCTGSAEPVLNGLGATVFLHGAEMDDDGMESDDVELEQVTIGVRELVFESDRISVSNTEPVSHDLVSSPSFSLAPVLLETGSYGVSTTTVVLGPAEDEPVLDLRGELDGIEFRLIATEPIPLPAPTDSLLLQDGLDYQVRFYLPVLSWFEGIDLEALEDQEPVELSATQNAEIYERVVEAVGQTLITRYPGEPDPEGPSEADTDTDTDTDADTDADSDTDSDTDMDTDTDTDSDTDPDTDTDTDLSISPPHWLPDEAERE